MHAVTADDLYEMVKQLSTNERLLLVEKIAHDLTSNAAPGSAPAPRSHVPGPAPGARTRTQLVGLVTDITVEPLCFKVRTARGPVSVAAGAHLVDAVWSAWGQEVIVEADAILDADGAAIEAEAIALDLSAEADDLVANFESTFGSGSEIWSTREARERLAAMRGGGA